MWIQDPKLTFLYDNEISNLPITINDKEYKELKFNNEDIKFLKNTFIINEKTVANRKNKFIEYHQKYKSTNLLKIDIASAYSPFCYPYLAKNENEANTLVEELTEQGLIIYRYWNNLPQNYNEYKFYKKLVPIPLM